MYIPISELQQYKGQWACPYCVMDMRDEERRRDERSRIKEEKKRDEIVIPPIRGQELCERCGRVLINVYIVNGKKLCGSCLDAHKDEWKRTGPDKPPLSPYRVKTEKSYAANLTAKIEQKIGELLALIGIEYKRKEKEKKERKASAFDGYAIKIEEKKKEGFSKVEPAKEESMKKVKRRRKGKK